MMPDPGPSFLADLPDERARRVLPRLGFEDAGAFSQHVARLAHLPAGGPAADAAASGGDLPRHLLAALAGAASPERALTNFERLAGSVLDPADLCRALAADPRGLEMLVTLFAGSQFLSEIVLRHPAYLDRLADRASLAEFKSPDRFLADARAAIAATGLSGDPAFDALRRFQRWELLRIGACDLAVLMDLSSVTAQLSHLADAVVQVCLERLADRLGVHGDEFAVLGMGKLGGNELNYSSDVDLLFLSAANATAYTRLGEQLIEALTQATAEGFLYRVDMRLRPWGQVGPLVTTIEGHLAYLKRHARLWEKQALLKARVVAGNPRVGQTFLRWAQPLLFTGDREAVRADVYAMKEQTEAYVRGRGRHWGDVKLGEGSIRDVEFVAQYLQLAHGAAHPEILTPNTQGALALLAEAGFLSPDEQRVLGDGYVFLRTVEHYLQMLEYRQTHTLPQDAAGLCIPGAAPGVLRRGCCGALRHGYQQHSAAIRAIYQRHLAPQQGVDGSRPMNRPVQRADDPSTPLRSAQDAALPPSSLGRHLSRMSPSYAATFSEAEISHHAELADLLSDHNPVEVVVEPLPEGGHWRVTVVAYDFLGELSLICGLLFAYGFSIEDGHVYTYEPSPASPVPDARRKIVDVFTVRFTGDAACGDRSLWLRYATDLAALLRLLQGRHQREAQGELAKRVAVAVRTIPGATPVLHPIDIEIDNDASERYTVLRIGADGYGRLPVRVDQRAGAARDSHRSGGGGVGRESRPRYPIHHRCPGPEDHGRRPAA